MSPADPIAFTVEILDGRPSPEALDWLQRGFASYTEGRSQTLNEGLGLTALSRGLRDSLKHARIRRAIVQAADLLPEGSTPYSKAKLIRSELLRLLRTWPRCTARSRMDELLLNALEAADGNPPTGLTTIRDIIAGGL